MKLAMRAPVVVYQRSLAILGTTQKQKGPFLALIVLLVSTQHHRRQVCAFHAPEMSINLMPTRLRASLFNLATTNRVLPQKSFVQPAKLDLVEVNLAKAVTLVNFEMLQETARASSAHWVMATMALDRPAASAFPPARMKLEVREKIVRKDTNAKEQIMDVNNVYLDRTRRQRDQ